MIQNEALAKICLLTLKLSERIPVLVRKIISKPCKKEFAELILRKFILSFIFISVKLLMP